MLNKIIKYVKDDEGLISLNGNYLHIYNFNKIINITNNSIELHINDKLYSISGNDFKVIKLETNEMLFKGTIKSIEIK